MSWLQLPLDKVLSHIQTGTTPSTKVPEYFYGNTPWYTPSDIGVNRDLFVSSRYLSQMGVEEGGAKLVEPNTLLVTCIGEIGRVGITRTHAAYNQQITGLRFCDSIDVEYAYYWFVKHRATLALYANQAVVPILNNAALKQITFSFPPLVDQKRIASILEQADHASQTRRFTQSLSNVLMQDIFVEIFGDSVHKWKVEDLGKLADVVSGVTKGQRFNGKKTIEAPYLRVANVQDGYLDLSEIKLIHALPSDVKKYILQPGDVVMTEGGDYDKLGRGAIWRGEIKGCIHQNHIFRVRVNRNYLLPEFFAAYLRSRGAKRYFLGASKQTTNLASINMTQLKALPVPLPPMELQQRFVDMMISFEQIETQQYESARHVEHLFETLLHRAFRGEL